MNSFWLNFFVALACVTGFLIREVMAIMARSNDNPPTWSSYWGQSRNKWNVALNALCTIGIMLGRNEVIGIGSSPKLAAGWPNIAQFGQFLQEAPILTALGIGLFGAFLIRWVTTMVSNRFGAAKKARQAAQNPSGDGHGI